jgi:hypothetical protein
MVNPFGTGVLRVVALDIEDQFVACGNYNAARPDFDVQRIFFPGEKFRLFGMGVNRLIAC